MKRISGFMDFLNEEFFERFKKNKKKTQKNRIESCVQEIIHFLNDNDINDWTDFINSGKVDRDIINKIIDHSAENMSELIEIRFQLRLKLSDNRQLREWLKELEIEEEFEKCAKVLKKISNR